MTTALIFTCELFLAVAGLIVANIAACRNHNVTYKVGYAVAILGVLAILATMSVASTSTPMEALWLTLGILFIGCPIMIAAIIGYLRLEKKILRLRNRC